MTISRYDIRKLKRESRCAIDGKHASLAAVTFIITVLNLLLNYLASSATPSGSSGLSFMIYLLAGLLVTIVYYILLSGVIDIYLNLCRDNPYKWSDLFSAFRNHPEPVAIYAVIQYFLSFTVTQTIMLFVASCSTLNIGGSFGLVIGSGVMVLVICVLYFYLQISFSMVLFVHADYPWIPFRIMMQRSWGFIRGRRLSYLYMQLSFIGMYALEVLSFGIGTLFVAPYIRTSEGLFYRKISGR